MGERRAGAVRQGRVDVAMTSLSADERAVAEALERGRRLLVGSETHMPETVVRTVRLLASSGIWHQLSRNQKALSCRDAAHKRKRLGHDGIPLWDELKSFFGRFTNAAGQTQYVIAHCRADRLLDLDEVARAVKAPSRPERLASDDLDSFSMDYGLVNPFESWTVHPPPYSLDGPLLTSPVLQVFDRDLLRPIGVPGTVMTNAGDLTWAVEVRADELCRRLDNTIQADIGMPDPEEPARRPGAVERSPIGIITGNAPESGIALWNKINGVVRDTLGESVGDVSMPPVTVESLPELGMSMELDRRREMVWAALDKAVVDMCRDGVRFLALACNTTPYFTPQIRSICAEFGTEFVSMPEVVGAWLRSEGIDHVTLLGISFVADVEGEWSAYRDALDGIKVEVLRPRALDRLSALAYDVKAEGAQETGLSKLRSFLEQEVSTRHIVLALTELSLLFGRQRRPSRSERVFIDPLALYGEALARRWLGLPFPMPPSTSPAKAEKSSEPPA